MCKTISKKATNYALKNNVFKTLGGLQKQWGIEGLKFQGREIRSGISLAAGSLPRRHSPVLSVDPSRAQAEGCCWWKGSPGRRWQSRRPRATNCEAASAHLFVPKTLAESWGCAGDRGLGWELLKCGLESPVSSQHLGACRAPGKQAWKQNTVGVTTLELVFH